MQKSRRRWWLWQLPICLLVLIVGIWAVFLWQEHVDGTRPVSRMTRAELVAALFSEDKELSNQAAIVLVRGPNARTVVAGPQTRAVKIGNEGSKDIVLILQETGSDTSHSSHYYNIVLLDQSGTILDKVDLPTGRVSTDVCDVADPPEPDGAQFIIRTSVPKARESAPSIGYVIGFSGRTYQGEIPRADYERLGRCRIAVQDHKFKALHPKMEWHPPKAD